MPRYTDFVERLLIPFQRKELLKKPLVLDSDHWAAKNRIDETGDEQLFGVQNFSVSAAAVCVRAGLYYLYDHLETAWRLVRPFHDMNSCYWLWMIERRRGEFSIARSWLDRVNRHPCYGVLYRRASDKAAIFAKQNHWDPYLLAKLCEQYRFGDRDMEEDIVAVQQIEWETLFEHTWQMAVTPAAEPNVTPEM